MTARTCHEHAAFPFLHGSPGFPYGLDSGDDVVAILAGIAGKHGAGLHLAGVVEASEIDRAVLSMRRSITYRHVGHEARGSDGVSR